METIFINHTQEKKRLTWVNVYGVPIKKENKTKLTRKIFVDIEEVEKDVYGRGVLWSRRFVESGTKMKTSHSKLKTWCPYDEKVRKIGRDPHHHWRIKTIGLDTVVGNKHKIWVDSVQ